MFYFMVTNLFFLRNKKPEQELTFAPNSFFNQKK